jgi:putative FmdB family regulatory protein
VPIYEFRCGACGERFEALVDAGTETIECCRCGSEGAKRAFSAQAAPLNLAKSGGELRRQERANAKLRAQTRDRLKEARKRARQR